MTDTDCLHCKVVGKVQGVAFRYYTQKKAISLGLCGWVRNLQDGRVEVLAQGDKAAISQFFEWLHSGSPSAKVDFVERLAATPSVEINDSFSIIE